MSESAAEWMSLAKRMSAKLGRLGLAAGAVVLLIGMGLALSAAPDLLQRLRAFPFIVLVLIGIPAAALLNTAEFKLICAMGRRSVGWLTSFEVSIITSAANMLPFPGGAITRTAAMCSEGISAKLATTLVVAFLISWMGAALLYSGMWISTFGHLAIAGAFILGGVLLLAFCFVIFRKVGATWNQMAAAFAIRFAGLALEAIRLMLAAASIGMPLSFQQASIFSSGAVAGSVVAIVPSGLGVTEGITALLAPLAQVSPAMGFLIAVVSRLSVTAGLLGLLLIVQMIRLRTRPPPRG